MVARVFLSLLLLAAPALPAVAQGDLGTLETGRYKCELPGDAMGLASVPLPDMWFDVTNASTYVSERGNGTYLLEGKRVTFTRGPFEGMQFIRSGARTLKVINGQGDRAKMRCVRSGRGAAD